MDAFYRVTFFTLHHPKVFAKSKSLPYKRGILHPPYNSNRMVIG